MTCEGISIRQAFRSYFAWTVVTLAGLVDPGIAFAAGAAAPSSDREASSTCSISASPIEFGMYDPMSSSPTVSVGTITYRCDARPPAGIKIGLSGVPLEATGGRALRSSSGDTLQYVLCLDASCLQPWGDGSNGTGVYFDPSPPIGTDVTISIFALIPAQQSADVAHRYHSNITVIAKF